MKKIIFILLIIIIACLTVSVDAATTSAIYQGLLEAVSLQEKVLYINEEPAEEENDAEVKIPKISIGEITTTGTNMPTNVVQIITVPVTTENIEDGANLNIKLMQAEREIDSSKYTLEGNTVTADTANIIINAGPEISKGTYTIEVSYDYEYEVQGEITNIAKKDFEITYIEINNIVIKQPAVAMEVGERTIITYSVVPNTFTNNDLKFISENEEVATITSGGLITAIGRGQTTLTISSLDDRVKATCQVMVLEPSVEITNLITVPEKLKQGEEGTIEVKIATVDLENSKALDVSIQKHGLDVTNYFTIEGNSVQNNEVNLVITPNIILAGSGEYTVVVSFDGKSIESERLEQQTKPFSIEGNIKITGITVNKEETRMVVDATRKINATLLPENAENKKLIWKSNNEEIATVDQNGEITAKSKGKAIITVCSDENSEIYKNITVIVQELVITEEYTIDNEQKIIKDIPANTDVTMLMENIILGADEYIIKNKAGETMARDELVGTNTTLSVEGQDYKLVITGDTNGDGRITITDVAKVQLHFVKLEELTEAYLVAADMNKTSDITITDLARIQLLFLGLISI